MKVYEIMTRDVVCVSPETPMIQIARLLLEHAITGVPIVENNRVIGIVTEEDIVMRYAVVEMTNFHQILDSLFFTAEQLEQETHLLNLLTTPARDLMADPVVSIHQNASLQELAALIVQKEVNPVPVLDDEGRLAGVATRHDLVRAMLQARREIDTPLLTPLGDNR